MLSKEGLAFIEVTPDAYIIMKTFISWEQLSSEKKAVSYDIILQAINSGAKFEIPDDLLNDSDINPIDGFH